MAEPTKFEDPTYWQGTAAAYPGKLAEFAAAIRNQFETQAQNTNAKFEQQAELNQKANKLHKSVEVAGEGGYLRLKRGDILSGKVTTPPEGEGDWELAVEDHVGEDTP